MTFEARCLCGACRYLVDGLFEGVIHCHCRRCRKFHGTTVVGYAAIDGTMQWLGGRDRIDTFTSNERTGPAFFCRQCGVGTPNPANDSGKLAFMPCAGTIVDLPTPPLEYHFYLASRAPWDRPPEGAPHLYDTVAPGFRDPGVAELDRKVLEGRICGSCLCGDVTFDASSAQQMVDCACLDCRLSRCASHATELVVATEGFRWQSGTRLIRRYERAGFIVEFCSRCSSPVPRELINTAAVAIPAGLLDNDPGMTPIVAAHPR